MWYRQWDPFVSLVQHSRFVYALLSKWEQGFEVTDMIHKAVLEFLKHRFEGRIINHPCERGIYRNGSKRAMVSLCYIPSGGIYGYSLFPAAPEDVQAETERVFELGRTMQLLVIDCDRVNHPLPLASIIISPTACLHSSVQSEGVATIDQISRQKSNTSDECSIGLCWEIIALCRIEFRSCTRRESIRRCLSTFGWFFGNIFPSDTSSSQISDVNQKESSTTIALLVVLVNIWLISWKHISERHIHRSNLRC